MKGFARIAATLTLSLPFLCFADIAFPPLTGHVVDNAGILDAGIEQELIQKLTAHEQATSNQVVIVTVAELQGYPIEEYAYRLGRYWGIGQKDKDNGVVLIVAQTERKVRIEVGYGLEGELTDAIASNIIHSVILPSFRTGDFNGGISNGTTAILDALGGKYAIQQPVEQRQQRLSPLLILLIFGFLFISIGLPALLGAGMGGRRSGGFYGGGSGLGGFGGGGGFSGGGGSFGGGGASGGW